MGDKLCLELEYIEVNQKGAKNEKKKKKKERRRQEMSVESEYKRINDADPRGSLDDKQLSFTRSAEAKNADNKDIEYATVNQQQEKENTCHGKNKFSTVTPDNNVTLVSAFSSSRCSYPCLSLAEMLEDEEQTDKDIEPIPADVIKSFQKSKEKSTELRRELRQDLKQRFANYCKCHNTQYCPEWCVQKKSLIAARYK